MASPIRVGASTGMCFPMATKYSLLQARLSTMKPCDILKGKNRIEKRLPNCWAVSSLFFSYPVWHVLYDSQDRSIAYRRLRQVNELRRLIDSKGMVTTAPKEVVTQFLQSPPTFIEYRDASRAPDKEQVQRVI